MIIKAVDGRHESRDCRILHLGHRCGYGVALMIGLVR